MQPADQQTVNQFLGVSATTDTMNGGQLSPPGSVTVSVLNGTGTYDEGITTANSLQQLGFDVVGTGDTPAVATQSETLVTYDQMTPSDEAAAQAVADSLSGAVTLAYGPTDDGAAGDGDHGQRLQRGRTPNHSAADPGFHHPRRHLAGDHTRIVDNDAPIHDNHHGATERRVQRTDVGGRAIGAVGSTFVHGIGRRGSVSRVGPDRPRTTSAGRVQLLNPLANGDPDSSRRRADTAKDGTRLQVPNRSIGGHYATQALQGPQ